MTANDASQQRFRSNRRTLASWQHISPSDRVEDLLARWSESHRKAPQRRASARDVDAIQALADDGLHFDREAVERPAWFHDAIYDIGRDDNEDRSAELARAPVHFPVRDECGPARAGHQDPQGLGGRHQRAVLSDADLSVRHPRPATALRGRGEEYHAIPTTCSTGPGACARRAARRAMFHTGPGRDRVGRIRRAATSQPRSRR